MLYYLYYVLYASFENPPFAFSLSLSLPLTCRCWAVLEIVPQMAVESVLEEKLLNRSAGQTEATHPVHTFIYSNISLEEWVHTCTWTYKHYMLMLWGYCTMSLEMWYSHVAVMIALVYQVLFFMGQSLFLTNASSSFSEKIFSNIWGWLCHFSFTQWDVVFCCYTSVFKSTSSPCNVRWQITN